ncbi:MAG: MerR family transcriptional regulator [Lachnospiraceae bacterium]|nr:MerR family transcriptional regulator [Lachnospiraceae bacterium]
MSYSSGEVCGIMGFSLKTLRLYEEQGLVCPRRNEENGYREYRAEDIFSLLQVKKHQAQGNTLADVNRLMFRDTFSDSQQNLEVQISRLEEQIQEMTWRKEHLEMVMKTHENNYHHSFQVVEDDACGTDRLYECSLYSDSAVFDVQKIRKIMHRWGRDFSHLNIVVVQDLRRLLPDGSFAYTLGVVTKDPKLACLPDSANSVRIVDFNSNLVYPMLIRDPFSITPEMIGPLRDYAGQHHLMMPGELHMYYNTSFYRESKTEYLFSARAVWEAI